MEEEASSLFRVNCQVVINSFCGLLVIFCGFISHLIGRETINIPEILSGVHGFTGKTVTFRREKNKGFSFYKQGTDARGLHYFYGLLFKNKG